MPVFIQDRTNKPNKLSGRAPRVHPHGGDGRDSRGRYYDFKVEPHLIETVLEDFTPHRANLGVQKFFALIRRINRPDGPFETTDSALAQSFQQSRTSHEAGWVGGRLMFMWRKLEKNCEHTAVNQLLGRMTDALRRSGQAYKLIGFVVSPFPTLFRSTGRKGFQIEIKFQMCGDSFEDCMSHFADAVKIMEKAFEECEKDG